MKSAIIGFIIGVLLMGQSCFGVPVEMTGITVYDMFLGFSMCGILASGCGANPDLAADMSSRYAKALYGRRNTK